MEAETPPCSAPSTDHAEEDLDSTIHGFNANNVTVIERHAPGDGSDSGVEDAFDLLARKNSTTLLQDLKDSGSETSSTSSRPSTSSKKKVAVQTPPKIINNNIKKMPPKKPAPPRPSTLKTTTTTTPKPKPQEKPTDKNRPRPPRSASTTRTTPRTPVITPTDDGRWPSNSKNTMSRSFRASSVTQESSTVKSRVSQLSQENKTLDKYATLPRRRRERSADNVREPSVNRTTNLRKQNSRESTPARSLPPYPKKKTRIFAEVCAQTSLTLIDLNRLIDSGTLLERGERIEIGIQTEKREDEAVTSLKQEVKSLQIELAAEKREKHALQEELERNMQRVQAILDNTPGQNHQHEGGDDSILQLESRFEAAGQVIIKQENEISELHNLCRSLQRELDVSHLTRQQLESAQQELESESRELQEFLAAEKWALCEALAEAEARGAAAAAERARLRHDALNLEARSRDLLLAQGAAVSGAAVALSGLAHRLDTLTGKLAQAYNISEQQLDDDVYHNEAYNPDTPESPQLPGNTSFLSAVISAIRNTVTENTDSEDTLLDSETEPCLMMDNVLEDVVHIDTHTHNLVSEPGASASSLVDQVIEADNLLTRLLKVLRVIQRVQDTESAAIKADLQAHRIHVERLSQDVCALSTACSTQRPEGTLEIVNRLKEVNKAVDTALETLNDCSETISEIPSLQHLQQTLEAASTACRQPETDPSDHNANSSSLITTA